MKGFQRLVKETRAKEIARTVLDTHRTFPNAVVLATHAKKFTFDENRLSIPSDVVFLVVDGQHRLWAQKYSEVEGTYPCIIHMHRTDKEMAALFLEINDKQRRVPSSLRWDLVRLVREEKESMVMTSDIIYALATREESPFFSTGIDLTGEAKLIIKQGSLAPEIEILLRKHLGKSDAGMEEYFNLFIRFFVALRSLDPQNWGTVDSVFYRARVLRALLRVLSDLLAASSIEALTTEVIRSHFAKIDQEDLRELRGVQGSTGVQDLYKKLFAVVLDGRS